MSATLKCSINIKDTDRWADGWVGGHTIKQIMQNVSGRIQRVDRSVHGMMFSTFQYVWIFS